MSNVQPKKQEKNKNIQLKKRETKLFQSHSGISVLPVTGHWYIFITVFQHVRECRCFCVWSLLGTFQFVKNNVAMGVSRTVSGWML